MSAHALFAVAERNPKRVALIRADLAQAAIGFRVKSGWSTVVLLAGSAGTPKVIDRRVLQLADPSVPESSQPYHAALDLPKGRGAKAVAGLVKVVERFASRSVAELIKRYRDDGHRILGAGIVVGSDIDPATIGNDHIRAHAEEGRLFRVVIADAATRCGLTSAVVVEKQLLVTASRALGLPPQRLKAAVTALGRGLGGHWRAEEKAATLAAWTVLAGDRFASHRHAGSRPSAVGRQSSEHAMADPPRTEG